MKKHSFRNPIMGMAMMLGILAIIGCGGYNKIVKMPEVDKVPAGQYEKIVRLDEFKNMPNSTLVGLVFIKKGARICVDYPRQEIIKSLNELTPRERNDSRYFSSYSIMSEGKVIGYASVPADYNAILWENEQGEVCRYKVSIELANKERGNEGGFGIRGIHGGFEGRGGMEGHGR